MYTKGPWTCDIGVTHVFIQSPEKFIVAHEMIDAGSDEEACANGHLISAAPELLEALEAITEKFDPDWLDCYVSQDARDLHRKALAAIAKAKGE